MTISRKLDYVILDMIESSQRTIRTAPLNLGAIPGAGGGEGAPPGGFIGWLPQTRVAYDTDELATLDTPASGQSLLDNLNHIRYRIQTLESGGSGAALTVEELDGSPSVTNVDKIVFSGATVTDLGSGDVLVSISGGSGTSLTVQEADGSPIVTNVDTIVFSGMQVTDNGSGDALVSPIMDTGLVFYFTDSSVEILEDGLAMKLLNTTKPSGGPFTTTQGALAAGETKNLTWATKLGHPTLETLTKGGFRFYLTARQTAGTREMRLKIKLYKQNTGGTQTFLTESNTSSPLTASYALYDMAVWDGPFALDATDRLVAKLYFVGGSSGTNATVNAQWGNTSSGERIELSTGHRRQAELVSETNSNEFYQALSKSDSAFAGTIATLPGGATLTYGITTGNEDAMVPSATTHLAKMRLYNTTRGNYALISNCVPGTNTLTLTANVPAGWAVSDVITIASQTVTGSFFGTTFVDLEITSGPLYKTGLILAVIMNDTGGAGGKFGAHPFETHAAGKVQQYITQTTQNIAGLIFQKITDNLLSVAWDATGAATLSITIREAGYLL